MLIGRSLHLWMDGDDDNDGCCCGCCCGCCRFALVGSGRAVLMAIILFIFLTIYK